MLAEMLFLLRLSGSLGNPIISVAKVSLRVKKMSKNNHFKIIFFRTA